MCGLLENRLVFAVASVWFVIVKRPGVSVAGKFVTRNHAGLPPETRGLAGVCDRTGALDVGTLVRGVRARDDEWLRWAEAAAAAGESLNGWLRRAASEQAQLEEALRRADGERSGGV